MSERIEKPPREGSPAGNLPKNKKNASATMQKMKDVPPLPASNKKAAARKENPQSTIAAVPEPTSITHERRLQLIAEAAYFRAEKRGFDSSYQVEDWLAAEEEINLRFPW